MNDCIIGIGSNIEAEKNIAEMMELLSLEVEVIQVSQFIQTKPIGLTNQPDFTNGAVHIHTDMEFEELASYLKKLEDQMGRDRKQLKFGPRNIDLDIMIWNGTIVDHDYYTRDFLRSSAAELGFNDNNI